MLIQRCLAKLLLAITISSDSLINAESIRSDRCAGLCADAPSCRGWRHDGVACILEDEDGAPLPLASTHHSHLLDMPCNGTNKQKSLYLSYDWGSNHLKDSPALDISVETLWNSTKDMRRYGANGVYAAHPIYTADGVGGYFGSQSDGDSSRGGLLFSIWDKRRKAKDVNETYCSLTPNRTWCERAHAFPLSANCHRHCLDCGLHPGWHNTSGTQCGVSLNISEGDGFRFRFVQTKPQTTLRDPTGFDFVYTGSVWTLTATKLNSDDHEAITVGSMFFEDTFEGIVRIGAFHEHIGCTQCEAFYESEIRRGPWVDAPQKHSVNAIGFTRKTPLCELFDVDILDLDKIPAAQFKTGPGTGPSSDAFSMSALV